MLGSEGQKEKERRTKEISMLVGDGAPGIGIGEGGAGCIDDGCEGSEE